MLKIRDLINSIKKRPEIYIGEKSFSRLISFIKGYEYCQNKYININSVFSGFRDFVYDWYNFSFEKNVDFDKIILLYSSFNEAEAFDNFFKIFDEWKEKNVAQIKKSTHNIYKVLEDIQKCPNVFFNSKSLNKLMPFIYGYEMCESQYDSSYQKFKWNELYNFLVNKYFINKDLTLNVESIIKFISDNDVEAFDIFFLEYSNFIK